MPFSQVSCAANREGFSILTTDNHTHVERSAGLLRNRNFILLWCAYAVSAMGDHLSEMAILKTQHALDVQVDITALNARMAFVFFLPFFLLSSASGVLADRLPRRALMVSADLMRCIILAMFATLILWAQDWGVWGVFLPLSLVGVFAAIFSPARSALLSTIVPPKELARANGIISGLGIIATMVAAKVGGYLADYYPPTVAFRVDAATFVASAVLLMFIVAPRLLSPESTDHQTSVLADLRAGFRYARSHRHVVELLGVAALVWFCGPLVNSVLPAIVRDVYHGTYQDISNYRALLGLGFILGAILVSVIGDTLHNGIIITWGLFGISASIAVLASSVILSRWGWPASTLATIGGCGVVAAGLFAVSIMATFNAMLQRTVANRYRGRIFGVTDVCTVGALLLATGAIGLPTTFRVDRWVGEILLVVSLITFAAGVLTFFVRLKRNYMDDAIVLVFCHLAQFISRFWWRMQRLGPATLPREGGVIITANHTSSVDPFLLHTAATYRLISYMFAKEHAEKPFIRWFAKKVECILVKRDGQDTGATKQAMRFLREGKVVGIFIEGGIVPPGEKAQPKDGVALLALRTGATVIPAYISGVTYYDSMLLGFIMRHRARVRMGKPVDLSAYSDGKPSRDQIREATRKIYAAVQALSPSQAK